IDVNDEIFLFADTVLTSAVVSARSYTLRFYVVADGDLTFFVAPAAAVDGVALPAIMHVGSELVLSTIGGGDGGASPKGGFPGQRFPDSLFGFTVFVER